MTPAATDFLAAARFLRPEDLASLMGWTADTTRAKIARRQCPRFIRVKRCTLFRYDDVQHWLETEAADDSLGQRQAVSDILRK